MQTNFLEPVASPQASVSQNVGMTKIEIYYSSPRVKGRTIFGDLVPYDKLWRAGANGPTSVVFSTSVKIGGEVLRAGKYSIAMTPSEKGNWKIDFNLISNKFISTNIKYYGFMTLVFFPFYSDPNKSKFFKWPCSINFCSFIILSRDFFHTCK